MGGSRPWLSPSTATATTTNGWLFPWCGFRCTGIVTTTRATTASTFPDRFSGSDGPRVNSSPSTKWAAGGQLTSPSRHLALLLLRSSVFFPSPPPSYFVCTWESARSFLLGTDPAFLPLTCSLVTSSLPFFFFFSLSFIDVFAAGVCGRFHLSQVHCLSALVVNASMIFLYLVGLHIVTCTHVIICS